MSPSQALDAQLLGFSTMLAVKDIDRSERFYADHLGFAVTERLESLRRLERDGARLYLVLKSAPTPDKPTVTLEPPAKRATQSVNLIFRVRDVHRTYELLLASAMQFLAPPQQPPWGGWRCFSQDPDGYLIEFEQPA